MLHRRYRVRSSCPWKGQGGSETSVGCGAGAEHMQSYGETDGTREHPQVSAENPKRTSTERQERSTIMPYLSRGRGFELGTTKTAATSNETTKQSNRTADRVREKNVIKNIKF